MANDAIIPLIHNASLLIALAYVFDLFAGEGRAGERWWRQVALGLILGAVGMAVMLTRWQLAPGIVFDTRSVLLGVTGLFFGSLPALIAMVMCASLRVWQGGAGAPMGVSVIVASVCIGIAWRRVRAARLGRVSWGELYTFGMLVHVVMLVLTLALPPESRPAVLRAISLPVILIYPVATAVLGKLMARRLERQAASEALATSEARYRSLFENNHAVMLIVDPDGGAIVDANPAAARYYGWSRDELRQRRVSDISTLSAAETQEEMNRARREERNHFLFRHRLADGTVRDVEVFSGPIIVGGRRLLYAIIHDIAARTAAEAQVREAQAELRRLFDEAESGRRVLLSLIEDRAAADARLRESEQRYRQLVESTDAIAWEYSIVTDRWVYVAPQSVKVLGYDPEEWVNLAFWSDRLHPDDRGWAARYCAQCTERAESHSFEYRFRAKDGHHVWLRDVVSVETAEGRPVTLRGYMIDITERKRAEAELREREERFRRLYEQSPAPYQSLDADGTILEVNSAWLAEMGYTRDGVIGKPFAEFLDESGRAEFPRRFAALKQDGQVRGAELVLLSKSGAPILASLEARAERDADGAFLRSHGIFVNITARKALEDSLRQAQKMESVGRLAGGVAHDFNNMLQVIIGYAAMGLETTPKGHPLHEGLTEILGAARRSSELTRQLLAFARKQTVAPRVLDLNETLAGMLRMLHRLIGEDVELTWKPGPGLWPVRMDPAQVDQILANLAVNARDAMTGKGTLTVQTDNVTLARSLRRHQAAIPPGQYVLLSVGDSGCGMSPEAMEHLFEPFFTTKEQGKGTGLGLPTVYGIVTQNHGHIDVLTEAGKGTTFRIYLPRDVGTVETEDAPDGEFSGVQGSETILLVEDELAILGLGQAILKRRGFNVLTASSPEQALNLVREHPGPIHLLLTDVIMPHLNGRELYDAVAAERPGIKVLFMSGYTAEALAPHGVLSRDVEFLQKPFSVREITMKVRAALDR